MMPFKTMYALVQISEQSFLTSVQLRRS